MALAESQREALRLAVTSKVLVITGRPGVGKTTLVNSILRVLAANFLLPTSGRGRREGSPRRDVREP